MRRLLLALAIALVLPSKAWATWSIIAIDRATGRVVISSSTCAANAPDNLKLLQAIVVPGVGVAAAQAGVDGTHANQKLIFEQMRMGTDPQEILRMLHAQETERGNPNMPGRQFGIIDMQGRTAGFSGTSNGNFSRHYLGISDDGKLVYGVQGNIIKTEEALSQAAQLMKTDTSEMLDRVMLAMEKANSLGGDSRCTCTSGGGGAIPGLPCTNRTTSVGYILAADPTDARGPYAEMHPQIVGTTVPNNVRDLRAPWNDGDYYLYIAVYPGNFRPNEDAAPVCTLRLRYDAWVAQGRPRMNLKAPAPIAPRTVQPPAPAAPAGEGRGGGGGGRGGGAAQPAQPGGRGGGAAQPGGRAGGQPAAPAPYTGPTTAACSRAASVLPADQQEQAMAAPSMQRAAEPRRTTAR